MYNYFWIKIVHWVSCGIHFLYFYTSLHENEIRRRWRAVSKGFDELVDICTQVWKESVGLVGGWVQAHVSDSSFTLRPHRDIAGKLSSIWPRLSFISTNAALIIWTSGHLCLLYLVAIICSTMHAVPVVYYLYTSSSVNSRHHWLR